MQVEIPIDLMMVFEFQKYLNFRSKYLILMNFNQDQDTLNSQAVIETPKLESVLALILINLSSFLSIRFSEIFLE